MRGESTCCEGLNRLVPRTGWTHLPATARGLLTGRRNGGRDHFMADCSRKRSGTDLGQMMPGGCLSAGSGATGAVRKEAAGSAIEPVFSLNWASQGQRRGRFKVRRQPCWVSRPASWRRTAAQGLGGYYLLTETPMAARRPACQVVSHHLDGQPSCGVGGVGPRGDGSATTPTCKASGWRIRPRPDLRRGGEPVGLQIQCCPRPVMKP